LVEKMAEMMELVKVVKTAVQMVEKMD